MTPKSHCANVAADGLTQRLCILNALMKLEMKYESQAWPITIFKNNEVHLMLEVGKFCVYENPCGKNLFLRRK